MDTIPLNRPDIRSREHEALDAALSAHARCERGPVAQLEETAARVAGRPCAVAAASSGIAIEAAMLTVGLRLGDEVVCPAYGPARLVAGISRAGGRPRFVDAQPRTGGYYTTRMEAAINDRTRAIVVAPTWFDPATRRRSPLSPASTRSRSSRTRSRASARRSATTPPAGSA